MSPDVAPPDWKQLYTAAVLELDKHRLLARIHEAKMAIFDRIEELNGGGTLSERTALQRALKALGELHDVYFGDLPVATLERMAARLNRSRPQDAA